MWKMKSQETASPRSKSGPQRSAVLTATAVATNCIVSDGQGSRVLTGKGRYDGAKWIDYWVVGLGPV